jgi:hypothetical protein
VKPASVKSAKAKSRPATKAKAAKAKAPARAVAKRPAPKAAVKAKLKSKVKPAPKAAPKAAPKSKATLRQEQRLANFKEVAKQALAKVKAAAQGQEKAAAPVVQLLGLVVGCQPLVQQHPPWLPAKNTSKVKNSGRQFKFPELLTFKV